MRLAICMAAAVSWPTYAGAQFIEGIDVSHWQGSINWSAVKNSGVEFAFVKATEGVDFVDSRYHSNMQGARAAGVLVGAYHFCRLDSFSTNPQDPINEANDFVEALLPYYRTGLHLPPVADVERFPPFGSTAEAQAFTSNWVQKFSDTVYDALGVRPIVYNSLSKANSYYTRSIAATHELWLAWWKSTANPPVASDTPFWGEWQFWQWTDSWSVPGVSTPVDGDLFNGSLAELQQLLLGNDGATPGDFNRDGSVDAADYVVWRKSMGQTVPIYSGADADGNSHVTAADFAIWKQNVGAGGGGAASPLEVVPEPATLALALLCGCMAAAGGRPNRWRGRLVQR
jgi:GH25 family lysozyme M1 (1,4-beta-N-acetylmuramidase)